jgi:hypothetical protein
MNSMLKLSLKDFPDISEFGRGLSSLVSLTSIDLSDSVEDEVSAVVIAKALESCSKLEELTVASCKGFCKGGGA